MRRVFALTMAIVILISGFGYYIYDLDDMEIMKDHPEKMIDEYGMINREKTYRNSNLDRDYVELNISDEDHIIVEGKTTREYDSFMVDIFKKDDKEVLYRDERRLGDGLFKFSRNYKLEDGDYEIKVYYGNKSITSGGWYVKYQAEVETFFQVYGSELKFPNTDIYYHNKKILSENNNVKKRHTSLILFSADEQKLLRDLARRVIGEEKDPYNQVFLISDWVAKNIYYDYDALEKGEYDITKAIDTLNAKRSICQGYANLTEALVRAIDIPCRKTIGYLIGGTGAEDETWNDVKKGESNHIWNEVYVNGRWIIIDSTLNSTNIYEKGEFIRGESIYSYFDMTLKAFSDKHRIGER